VALVDFCQVSKAAQVELRSGRLQDPASRPDGLLDGVNVPSECQVSERATCLDAQLALHPAARVLGPARYCNEDV